jgi:glycosyltransferase involved in cell wall biosynthesis
VFTTTAYGREELDVEAGREQMVDGVPVTYFGRISGDPTHFSPELLWRLWKDLPSYDILHVHAWWNTVSVLGALIAFLRRKPVVLSPRGTLSPYSFTSGNALAKRIIHALLGTWLLRKSWLHVTSRREEKEIRRLAAMKKTVTIPNLIRFPAFIPDERPVDDRLRIVFFSRIDKKKGLDILVRALAKLSIPYEFCVAGMGGNGYPGEIRKLAAALGVAIHWMDAVTGDAKYDFLAAYDLMVLPSRNENFGNVVVESLLAGTPVIVSDEVGLSDYIATSGFGWICQAEPEQLASCISGAYADREKRRYIRQHASKAVMGSFDRSLLARRYIEFYHTIIHERL